MLFALFLLSITLNVPASSHLSNRPGTGAFVSLSDSHTGAADELLVDSEDVLMAISFHERAQLTTRGTIYINDCSSLVMRSVTSLCVHVGCAYAPMCSHC